MKRTHIRLFAIAFISVVILFYACGHQQAGWQGTVEEVNGVRVVKNPEVPMLQMNAISLEEEICIKEKRNSNNPLFIRVRAIQVDDNGNIYILDSKTCSVKIFDDSGLLIGEFGGKGQGPGEFQSPMDMEILLDKSIIICDIANRRFSFFSKQGKFLRSITPEKYNILRIRADSYGHLYGYYLQHTSDHTMNIIGKFSDKLDLITNVVSFKENKFSRTIIDMQMPRLWYLVTSDGYLVWGYSSEYMLHVVNQDGLEIRRIFKEHVPIKITETEKKWLINDTFRRTGKPPEGYSLKFPEYYNPYDWRFISDDKGRIIVGTTERAKDNRQYYDIFDSDGCFLTKILLRFRPVVWKQEKMYFNEEDEEGNPCIKRYNVVWEIAD